MSNSIAIRQRRFDLWHYLSRHRPLLSCRRELVVACHYPTLNMLQRDLLALRALGYIDWGHYRGRAIRVLVTTVEVGS